MLKSIQLQGLLSFPPDSPPLRLNNLNVLIGANGSGKSNFIDALELLGSMPNASERQLRTFGGPKHFFWQGDWRGQEELASIEFSVFHQTSKTFNQLEVFDENYDLKETNRSDEFIKFIFNQSGINIQLQNEILRNAESIIVNKNQLTSDLKTHLSSAPKMKQKSNKFSRLKHFLSVLSSTSPLFFRSSHFFTLYDWKEFLPKNSVQSNFWDAIYRTEIFLSQFNTYRDFNIGRKADYRKGQSFDYGDDFPLPSLNNLAVVLNEINNRDAELINEPMRRIMKRFDRLSVAIGSGVPLLQIHEIDKSDPTPIWRMSDGTLRILSIIAHIHAKYKPSLLCIEEPEIGLHPDALYVVADLLKEASTRMQVVVSTHSDVLLHALAKDTESVIVFDHDGRGTTMKHLDSEQMNEWLKNYTLDEMWAMGMLGGTP
ncbi:MAG: AAA family ATPase [Candidatus Pacebacteria bacterium]|nr:AAA family ATPase [Candidatus Paceibacterota bacterium]